MDAIPTDRSLVTRTSLVAAAAALLVTVEAVELLPSLPRAVPHQPRFADAAILCGTRHCIVDRTRLRMLLDHPSRVGAALRIMPLMPCGHMRGFRVYAIRPGSLPARLLLRNGDTVVAMNQIPIDSPDAMIRAYHTLRDARSVSLDLVRNGRPLRLSYAIR